MADDIKQERHAQSKTICYCDETQWTKIKRLTAVHRETSWQYIVQYV